MKVLVIGSGLIGLTSAHFLKSRGEDVTVIDRADGPGQETSFANAALLTPSMAEPWNAPGSWRVLLSSLGRSDSAMQLRARALPGVTRWGIAFLRNSRVAPHARNTLNNLRLALYSLEVMQTLREETNVEYGAAARGTLRIFRDRAALDRAVDAASGRKEHGLSFRKLSGEETAVLEPALTPIAEQLAGAIHYETDETGDPHRFCVALADHLRQRGVEFHFRTEVSDLEVRAGWVTAAATGRERFVADRYVVAAGSPSAPLLRRVGVSLPMQPVKGYSITFHNQTSLRIPVADDDFHAAVTPLDGALRVGGTAEFTGFDRTLDPARIRNLLVLLSKVLPREKFDPATGIPWCGLRPMSVDGVPIIGRTPILNLYVNTGHGHLGWTMAAGSGKLLTDLLCGTPPALDPHTYSLARFGAM
jgi:D-amino-acid dehydrogenase